jgi:TonB family protein
MASFVNYLVESGVSLSLFALVYFLFLRRETFFNLNRWFLLVSVAFSAILPLVHIPVYAAHPTLLKEVTVTPYANLLNTVTVYGADFTQGTERFVLSYSLIGYLYLAGVLFFALKLLVQLAHIHRLIRRNTVVPEGKIRMVILEGDLSPFSFLNYIFVSKNLQHAEGWEKMLEHERQHILQGHSVDVLVLEVIAVLQWFNPFFWLFRRALRENHEFLADQAVLSHGTAPSRYKQILINQYVGDQILLANNFNYSLIKTRIKMMSKIKSKKIAGFKILIGFVLAASLVLAFACEQKDAVKADLTGSTSKTITLVADGHSLQVSGDSVGIEQLKAIIEKSGTYAVKKDSADAAKLLIQKITPEKAVAAYSEEMANDGGDKVYFKVEKMPEYPGGMAALGKFLGEKVEYPADAKKKGIEGKVFVNFLVEKDGSVTNVKVLKGVSSDLDQEARRVVSMLPKWTPGEEKGQPVRVAFTLPINFKLQ